MFDVIRRWATAPDPVRFAGWCGEMRNPVLSERLTHTGGTDGDLAVIEFCDKHFGTTLARDLRIRTDRSRSDWMDGHGGEGEFKEECGAWFAFYCEHACRKLRRHGIAVVDESGNQLLNNGE